MNNLISLLRDFLAAQRDKVVAKSAWIDLSSDDDGYYEKRNAFRTADDRCEELFEQVVPALQQAQGNDEVDEVIDALGTADSTTLSRILSERGLEILLSAAPTSLAGNLTKYRKASALYSAARELNARRRQLDSADFEEVLDTLPAGVDAPSWQKVITMLRDEEAFIEDASGDEAVDLDSDDITAEAAYRIECRTRERYDELGERLVNLFREMMDNGSFDRQVADVDDAELRRMAYDFQRRVPMPQVQPETKVQPREVAVLDRLATELDDDTLTDSSTWN